MNETLKTLKKNRFDGMAEEFLLVYNISWDDKETDLRRPRFLLCYCVHLDANSMRSIFRPLLQSSKKRNRNSLGRLVVEFLCKSDKFHLNGSFIWTTTFAKKKMKILFRLRVYWIWYWIQLTFDAIPSLLYILSPFLFTVKKQNNETHKMVASVFVCLRDLSYFEFHFDFVCFFFLFSTFSFLFFFFLFEIETRYQPFFQ